MNRVVNTPAFLDACDEDEKFFRDNSDRLHHVRVAKIAELAEIRGFDPDVTQYVIVRRSGKNYYKVLMSVRGEAPKPNDTEWNAAYLFQHFAPPALLKMLVNEDPKAARRPHLGPVQRPSGAVH